MRPHILTEEQRHKKDWSLSSGPFCWPSRPSTWVLHTVPTWPVEFSAHLSLANLAFWFLDPLLCSDLMILKSDLFYFGGQPESSISHLTFLGKICMVLRGYSFSALNYQYAALFPLFLGLFSPALLGFSGLLPTNPGNQSSMDNGTGSQSAFRSHSQFQTLSLTCFWVLLPPQILSCVLVQLHFSIVRKLKGKEKPGSHEHFSTFWAP